MLRAGELAPLFPAPKALNAESVPGQPVEAFYEGHPTAMAAMYRDHFGTVRAAVTAIVTGADGETVIHEIFLRLLSNEELRRAYRQGSGTFSGWLYVLSKHHALDYVRRRSRETPAGLSPQDDVGGGVTSQQIEARALVRKFREQVLPPKWVSVFDLRFVGQLDQREAARLLGIPRTTLVYREHRIRRLLRAFLLAGDEP